MDARRARTLLAFSGGPDSVGLAARMRDENPLLAYVDHGLRGHRASRAERASVKAAAAALGLELVRCRVAAGGSEASARQARYRALHRMLARYGCGALATAHSADDRAETVLLNLARGTGLRGLSAPLASTRIQGVARVRPALGLRRAELRAAAAGLPCVNDRSNRSTAHARVRVRRLLLPALEVRLGTDPVPLLCALADAAAEMRATLSDRAARMAGRAGRAALLAEPLATFPYLVEALRRRGPPLTARAYRALRDFLLAGRGDRRHVTVGGEAWLIRSGSVLVVSPA